MAPVSDARTLFLARHGETDWNAEGRWQGQTDVPLNAKGRAQAHALAERMRREGVAAIASSDLSRARTTAEIVAELLGIGAIHTDPDLREQRYGRFEGLTRKESEALFPEEWSRYVADWHTTPPDGEPYPALVARVRAALQRIAERLAPPALVIMHGGAIRAVLAGQIESIPSPASTGWALHGIPNGGIFRLVLSSGRIVEALRFDAGAQ
jgi:broad specificity phosphatase PhoE